MLWLAKIHPCMLCVYACGIHRCIISITVVYLSDFSSSKELPGSITFSQHGLKGHGSNIYIFAERKLRRYISVNTARLRYEERRWEKKQKRREMWKQDLKTIGLLTAGLGAVGAAILDSRQDQHSHTFVSVAEPTVCWDTWPSSWTTTCFCSEKS